MIFNKQKKIAFVLPPKTGTSTIIDFLFHTEWIQLDERHSKTDALLLKYPNLNNYKLYGFFRNPLERFKSAFLFLNKSNTLFEKILLESGLNVSRETISIEKIIDVIPTIKEKVKIIFEPQSDWLNHPKVTVLDFNNFETELLKISESTAQSIPKLNVSSGDVDITQKVIDFVRQEYAADYALAKDRLGKEY